MIALPTANEINVFDSLDERFACQNFLGKTLDEAELLFRENALFYQEDLMWMGPVAFRFYVPAYIRYLESEFARGDSDGLSCFAAVLEFRLDCGAKDVAPISITLETACSKLLAQSEKFDIVPSIPLCRGVADRLTLLRDRLRTLVAE